MLKTIESRELFTLDGLGVLVRGTFHKPDEMADSRLSKIERNRIGVVFLNSLFLPRTATGDSAVYWAESFARAGYPSFRLDLPGLGDSDAPLNTALLDFINAGGYEPIATAKIKELVEKYGLAGVVIVGHCAGSVSALYAAGASKYCKGLVLMDPYFFLPQQMKKSKAWKQLVRWAASSKFGGVLSRFYDQLKNARLAMRKNALPGNANFALLRRWKDVTMRGAPVLLFKAPGRKAPGTKPRVGEFDYLKHIMDVADGKSEVVLELIEGTDHSFANRTGRAAIRERVERWLDTHFPLIQDEYLAIGSRQMIADDKIAEEKHAPCL
jgi:alpha-beta hydrolase superfamily lysophospholipase